MNRVPYAHRGVGVASDAALARSPAPMTTEQAEAIGLAEYLRTCDDDEYLEYFEQHNIELGSQ